MPAQPWLVHFPDDEAIELGPHRQLPQPGDELLAGWIVTDYTVSERQSKQDQVDVWVQAKARRKTVRQRTDRA